MNLIKEFIKTENDAKSALIGTIFADGSIEKQRTPNGRASCEITHTAKNLDYLRLVKEVFEILPDCKCTIREHNKKSKDKTYFLYRLSTNRTDWLTQLRKDLYKEIDGKRIKIFNKEYINIMSDLGFLFMYLDDGCLRAKFGRKYATHPTEYRATFCLESFTLEELEYFQKWIYNRYNIMSKVYHHYKYENDPERGYRIWTNTTNTSIMMDVFDKFYDLVPSMKYKYMKYYLL